MKKSALMLIIEFLPCIIMFPSAQPSYACVAVAVVQSSQNPKFPAGTRICSNYTIEKPLNPIRVSCIESKKSFFLFSFQQLENCEKPSKAVNRKNSGNVRYFRPRSVTGQNKPYLTKPYGRFLMDLQPLLEWNPVFGAKSYTVDIWAKKRKLFQVFENRLSASSGMPFLEPGQTYTIIIKAISSNKTISRSVSAISVLSDEQIKEVKNKLNQLDSSLKNPVDKTYQRIEILTEYHLTNDLIPFLENQTAINPNNAKIYRVLAQTYVDAGLLYEAKQNYEKTEIVARNTNNLEEYNLAIEGLNAVVALINNEPLKP